jgi:hypothetical protein
MPCDSPVGQTTGQCGPEAAPASRTRRQAKGKETPTPETCGPLSFGSSESSALQSSLVSRLAQRLGTGGSIEYAETWKLKATPAGRQYWEHTASGHRTSASGCTGWPSPQAGNTDSRGGNPGGEAGKKTASLQGWTTPQTHDTHKRSKANRDNPAGGGGCLATEAELAGWGTPTSHERTFSPRQVDHGEQLANQVALTGWPTPNAMEGGSTSRSGDRKDELLMGGLVQGITWDSGPVAGEPSARPRILQTSEGGGSIPPCPIPCPQLTGWATPRNEDSESTGAHRGKPDTLHSQTQMAGWSSPTAQDYSRGVAPPRPTDTGTPLSQQVSGLSGWARPANRDYKSEQASDEYNQNRLEQARGKPLSWQVVGTGKPVASVLNPRFSGWLMGFPPPWDVCSPGFAEWLVAQATIAKEGK